MQNTKWARSRTQNGLNPEHGIDWIQNTEWTGSRTRNGLDPEHRNKLGFSKEGEQLILSPKVDGGKDTG